MLVQNDHGMGAEVDTGLGAGVAVVCDPVVGAGVAGDKVTNSLTIAVQ
jgi:hypothetical protein